MLTRNALIMVQCSRFSSRGILNKTTHFGNIACITLGYQFNCWKHCVELVLTSLVIFTGFLISCEHRICGWGFRSVWGCCHPFVTGLQANQRPHGWPGSQPGFLHGPGGDSTSTNQTRLLHRQSSTDGWNWKKSESSISGFATTRENVSIFSIQAIFP